VARFLLSVAFLGCVIAIVLFNAEAGASGHRDRAVASPDAPSHPGTARVFVLAIDSLRYQTAMDPRRMPALAALRQRATFAKTRTTNDAVTVPSMRAAFSGRDHVDPFRVFGNFLRGAPLLESIFDETRARGVPSLIMSDGSFDQFGGKRVADMMDNHAGGGAEVERQIRAFDRALAAFVSGRYDFVVAHVTFGDHAAHGYGVHSPDYDALFGDLDRLVAKANKKIGPQATLVVMGDHGHTEEGNHGMGLDVPTFLLYRGPGFAEGLDLGSVSITDHRYLLSHALSIPLPASYGGGRYPEALVSEGPLPPSFAARVAPEAHGIADYPASERLGLALVVGAVGVLAFLWLASSIEGTSLPEMAAIFVPLALLSLVWVRPLHAVASLAASAALLYRMGPRIAAGRARAFKLAALSSLGALLLFGWGVALAALRPAIHEPRGFLIDRAVAAAALLTALATLWRGPRVAMAGGLVAVGVLSYPTVYRYGAPSLFVPLWLCWLLSIFVAEIASEVRAMRGRFAAFDGKDALRNLGMMLGIGGAAAIGLLPFYRTSANQFCFEEWHGPLAPETSRGWLVAAIFAKAVLFFRPFRVPARDDRGARSIAATAVGIGVGVLAVAGLSSIEWKWITLRGGTGALVIAVLAALAWIASRRARRAPEWRSAATRLRLALRLAAGAFLLRLPGITWAWADWLFAALALSVDFAARARTEESRRWVPFFVWVLGVLVAGWVSLAWTLHRFEWAVLYDFADLQLADDSARWLLPLLLARFAIPVGVVRAVIDAGLPSGWGERRAFDAVGAKVFALSAMLLGLAAFSVATDLYVEAYEELLIFALLAPMLVRAARSDAGGARQAPAASATMIA